MADAKGNPRELVFQVPLPVPLRPILDQVNHGQGMIVINAVEGGVPTKGHRHDWAALTDKAENKKLLRDLAAYFMREGEISDDTTLVLADLAEVQDMQGWRNSTVFKKIATMGRNRQNKTLGQAWLHELVGASVCKYDFTSNLFNLCRHPLLLAFRAQDLQEADPGGAQANIENAARFNTAFTRQVDLAQEEFDFIIRSARQHTGQSGAKGARASDELRHLVTAKHDFEHEILFEDLNNVPEVGLLPDPKKQYWQLLVKEKREFWSQIWSWEIFYNMFEWAETHVPLQTNFESAGLGRILESAFCAFSDAMWQYVCKPKLERSLLVHHEKCRMIRTRTTLPIDSNAPYDIYRSHIAKNFPRWKPNADQTAADKPEEAYNGVEEVLLSRAGELMTARGKKRRNNQRQAGLDIGPANRRIRPRTAT